MLAIEEAEDACTLCLMHAFALTINVIIVHRAAQEGNQPSQLGLRVQWKSSSLLMSTVNESAPPPPTIY